MTPDDNFKSQSQSMLFTYNGETLALPQGLVKSPTPTQATAGVWQEGAVIDKKFRIISLIGQGGMGAVYRAHHQFLNKEIAIKTFKSTAYLNDAWTQFQNEARLLASLSDKHIIPVYDFGFADSHIPYYTMELLEGQPLDQKVAKEGPLPFAAAIDIFIQVCQGLAAAHKKGILHRDIKPANIFLEPVSPAKERSNKHFHSKFNVKLLDFGIAELATKQAIDEDTPIPRGCFGSPLYMSPEQINGGKLDQATDIYSCGCTFFQVLTGQPPFLGDDLWETLRSHLQEPAPPLTKRLQGQIAPERLEKLISKMLAKKPDQRCKSIAEVETELRAILSISLPSLSMSSADPHQPPATAIIEEDSLRENTISRKRSNFKLAVSAVIVTITLLLGLGAASLWSTDKSTADKSVLTTTAYVPVIFERTTEPKNDDPAAKTTKSGSSNYTNAAKQTPFLVSQSVSEKPDGMRHFKFPPHDSIGTLRADPKMGRAYGIDAKGDVAIPAGQKIYFLANQLLTQHPELFLRFGPDDLWGLELPATNDRWLGSAQNWDDNRVKFISHLSGLRCFACNETEITEASEPSFNALKNLDTLNLNNIDGDVSWVAKLHCLPKLKCLCISGGLSCTPVLDRLARGSQIEKLDLKRCQIGSREIDAIVKLKTLKYLILNENKMVTDYCVGKLAALPNLTGLEINRTGITPGVDEELIKLRKLNFILLQKDFLTAEQLAELSAKMGPKLRVCFGRVRTKKLDLQ